MRLAVVLLGLLVLVSPARAAWIELHNPIYGLPYCLTWSYFGTPSFLVVLHPDGATNIVGARLRISGLPSGCSIAVTPSVTATITDGDLFSAGGAVIMFASPQVDANVVLYAVTLSCPAEILQRWGYVTLQPDVSSPPTPGFSCPYVITTGGTSPLLVCAQYTQISDHPAWCEIGVAPTDWGAVKSLYR